MLCMQLLQTVTLKISRHPIYPLVYLVLVE